MKMKRLLYMYLFMLLGLYNVSAQEALRIIDYDYSKYPSIISRLFVFDNNGNPILNLNTGNFNVKDNDNILSKIDSYNCPQNTIIENVSYTIMFDLGLDNFYHNPTNFTIGVLAANRLINLVDTTKSEVSLTSYDYRSFLNREFTNSRTELLSEISKFTSASASKFEAAFINEPAGAFKINSRGRYDSKAIILITDGGGKYDEQKISEQLLNSGVKLFVISLRKAPVQSLKDLCINSGGWWFELDNPQKLNPVVYSVLAMSKGYNPCSLKWNMDYSCDDLHNLEIIVPARSVKDEFSFTFDVKEKSFILSDPEYMSFSSVDVGSKKSLPITLIAKNNDIFIKNLNVSAPFKITEGNVSNFLLKKDEFINIKIEYTPTKETIVFSQLEVNSDACEILPIYITGGFPNVKPDSGENTVKIVFPNEKEYLIVGDTAFVKWIGLLPKDVIQLEYTTDNGRTWLPLATNIMGLSHKWTIPNTPSDSCRVKIILLWPNNVGPTIDLHHNGTVNTAFFSSDGDLVLTSSDDATAAVWVANTGAKKFNLVGHNKLVHWAVFDPLGEFIATCSYDSTVRIWRMNDGSLDTVLRDYADKVESINFSPSGEYFVSSCYKGYSVVRDRKWNILKRVMTNDKYPTYYTEFNPINEDLILAPNGAGLIKEWNWKNYTTGSSPEKIFDTKSNLCKHSTYNTDATMVAATTSSGFPKKLYVWNVNDTENPIYSITHNADSNDNNSINYSSFFYHPELGKEVILTTSTDQTARLWNANDGTPAFINEFITENIFREHRQNVTTAVFDKFGTRLLTASWDSTAKIWSPPNKEIQIDLSDSLFTIAYARGKGMAVDMGTVYLGELKDSIVRAVFVNESEFPYNIKGYKFSGANADEFEILTDLKFPRLINSMDSIPLEIRFYPKSTGLRQAELEFELPAGVLVKSSIKGMCDLTSLKLNYPLVDFGGVEVGSFKDSTFSLIMTNESGGNIEIDSIYVAGSYMTEFTSVQNVGTILPNGQSIQVTLRFLPDYLGRKNAQYYVSYKGKGSPRLVNLFGEGTEVRNDTIKIYVKDFAAFPGDIIKVPIYISDVSSNGISDAVNGFTTNMKFNATLLEPLSGFSSSEIIGDVRHLKIDLPKTYSADSVLQMMEFKALWGNDTISPLTLEYTIPRGNGRIAIKEESAMFKLKGVCLQDGVLRLFFPGELSLSQNLPNPASERTSISFKVLEAGETRIVLNDVLGNEVKTFLRGYLTQGEHTIDIDVSGITPGLYYYTMITPSNILRKTMLITR